MPGTDDLSGKSYSSIPFPLVAELMCGVDDLNIHQVLHLCDIRFVQSSSVVHMWRYRLNSDIHFGAVWKLFHSQNDLKEEKLAHNNHDWQCCRMIKSPIIYRKVI